SSPTTSLSFWPSTPPLAFKSATARSAPRRNCSPKAALLPVIGPATAMVMSARAGALATAASTIAKNNNSFILDLFGSTPRAPAEQKDALVEPGILPHHLRGQG